MKYYLVIGINDKEQECLYSGTDLFISKTIYERNSSKFTHIVLKAAEIKDFVVEMERDVPGVRQYVKCDYCNKKLYRGVDSAYAVSIGDEEYYSVTCYECKKDINLTFRTDEGAFYWETEYIEDEEEDNEDDWHEYDD